jgi:hypothetical protein
MKTMLTRHYHKGQVVDQGAPKTECSTPIFETEIRIKRAQLWVHI